VGLEVYSGKQYGTNAEAWREWLEAGALVGEKQ